MAYFSGLGMVKSLVCATLWICVFPPFTYTWMMTPYLFIRGEISSGTVVTYNDRQEILCQKCTDIALHEEADEELPPSPPPPPSEEKPPTNSERMVSVIL